MTARSGAARDLEALLGRKAGQRIDVQWDTDSGGSWRLGWGVQWMDGPTVEQVKAWAHELAGDVAALDVDQLH
jgi:hypothetical protein